MKNVVFMCLLLMSSMVLSKSNNPLLSNEFFTEDSIRKLVCKPDPYIVFEQTLIWEIEYLSDLIDKLKTNEIKDILIEKNKELTKLRENCVNKLNS